MSQWVRTAVVAIAAGVVLAGAPAAQTRGTITVTGTVVDGALAPLAGVIVVLERQGQAIARATSNAQGVFSFTSIAAGTYQVRVTHAGYPAFARGLVVPAGATTVRIPIVLVTPAERAAEVAAPVAQAGRGGVVGGVVGPVGAGGRGGSVSIPSPPPAASAQTTVSADFIQALPRTDRNAMNFVTFLPGTPEQLIYQPHHRPAGGETYAEFTPNRFHGALDRPLSTFGADVDTASYSNVRRFLSSGQLPPAEAVRVEEMINYFRFDYATPRGPHPIALTTEIGDCPWAPTHKLVLIGARASAPAVREPVGRNIVLLVDVSGSMAPAERLPMIKTALGMFVDTLQPHDTLAIVTYAGTSGVALRPTPVRQRETVQHAIASLQAGGSTNGAAGLILAYRLAREAYVPGGVNRVMLATDGDFNVGITSQQDLHRLIERERESGVFLSVLGVGSGNLKDRTMEMLADRGNGHYAYLDSLHEARRVLIRQADSTLETVAKDVKFQVEFNPAVVSAWKLIGYETRALAARDFNDDRKDAGEMGAGHTVTVLYEVIPVGAETSDRGDSRPAVDPLRYQATPAPAVVRPPVATDASKSGEWLTVKARYKQPEGDVSQLVTQPVRMGGSVRHLPLAAAVAEYGILLRDAPRDHARWQALAARLGRLTVPAHQAADVDGFRELVGIGTGLARLR